MNDADLRAWLDDLYARLHSPAFLGDDPLVLVRRYPDGADREVVALIAASFAFGNVVAMRPAIERVLAPLGEHPATALYLTEPEEWRGRYRGFVYRWVRASDVRVFLAWIGGALRRHGSLGAMWDHYDTHFVDAERETNDDIVPTLERWRTALVTTPTGDLGVRSRVLTRASGLRSALPSGAAMLVPDPANRSACKRLLLFLRWVARPDDGIDLGLWKVTPSRLLMPVDTHILQVAHRLGWTTRPTADLRTAREITDVLRRVCPDDPTRYDYALTRPGIVDAPWPDAPTIKKPKRDLPDWR